MTEGVPSKVIAACSGLSAFAVAMIAGLWSGNPTQVVLGRALACMIVCQLLGMVIGMIGERTVVEAMGRVQSAGSSRGELNKNDGAASVKPVGDARAA